MNQKVSTVLLIGETGSGKSTFVNYTTNFFRNGSVSNPKVAISTAHWKATETDLARSGSEKGGNKMQSQTTGCFTYSFPRSGKTFNFIDTPGLSDTNGNAQDDSNIETISAAAAEAGFISAIVVIVNGTVARATANLVNVLVRLAGSLPDVLIDKNLLLVLTNCTEASFNFDLDYFKENVAQPKQVFYMQNSFFSNPHHQWNSNPKQQKIIQRDWEDSMETLEEIISTITSMEMTSTQAFKEMQENRNQIKSKITSLTLDVQNLNQLQEKLEAATLGLKNTEEDRKKYANFKKKETLNQVALVAADYHSTLCMEHIKDNKICHEKCGLEFSQLGSSVLARCACMSGGKSCNVCGCGAASHFHDKKKLGQTTVEVENILHDVKAQYEQMTATMGGLKGQVDQYTNDLSVVKTAVQDKHKQIKELCEALKKICSRFNFVSELKSVIDIMKKSRSSVRSSNALQQLDESIKAIQTMADQFSKGK